MSVNRGGVGGGSKRRCEWREVWVERGGVGGGEV